MNDDAAAVADADWVMTWLPEGGMQNLSSIRRRTQKKELSSPHACTIPTTPNSYSTNVEQT